MGCILGKKIWEEYFIYGSQGDVVEMFPFFFSLGDMFMKHSRIFLSKQTTGSKTCCDTSV